LIIKSRKKHVVNLEFPVVKLVYRDDLLPMTALDMRRYGTRKNKVASHVVKMTKNDHLQNTISLIYDLSVMDKKGRELEEQKLAKTPLALQAFKRYMSKENTRNKTADLLTVATSMEVLDGKKLPLARRLLVIATGVTTITKGDKKAEDALMAKLKAIQSIDKIGLKSLWEKKSVTCQMWLIANFLLCYYKINRSASRGSSSKRKTKKVVEKPNVKPDMIVEVLLRLWNAVMTVMKEKNISEETMLEFTYRDGRVTIVVGERLTQWVENQPYGDWAERDNAKWESILRTLPNKMRKGSELRGGRRRRYGGNEETEPA